MDAAANDGQDIRTGTTAMSRWHGIAWIAVLVADAGFVIWGAMAAALPDYLIGPNGTPILVAGYEGFTKGSWIELVATSPAAAKYIAVLFRLYGVFCVVFGLMAITIAVTAFRRGERWAWWALLVGNTISYVSAMTYDQIVHAIGPFELTEYLGLAVIYGALAVTASDAIARRSRPAS